MKTLHAFSLVALLLGGVARAEDAPAAKDATIEEFLQSLSTIKEVVTRRDPFAEYSPPFRDDVPKNGSNEPDPNAPDMSAPILERYTIAEYEVVAVLLGDLYPRALLRLPGEGGGNRKVVIVKEADKLGNRKGVISKITLEGIYVQQAQRSAHGFVDKTEVLLKVGGHVEEQKKSLTAKQVDAKTE
jgi:hypothetical protein